jgi:hypothetical protein
MLVLTTGCAVVFNLTFLMQDIRGSKPDPKKAKPGPKKK